MKAYPSLHRLVGGIDDDEDITLYAVDMHEAYIQVLSAKVVDDVGFNGFASTIDHAICNTASINAIDNDSYGYGKVNRYAWCNKDYLLNQEVAWKSGLT